MATTNIEPGTYQLDIVYYNSDGSMQVDHSWYNVENYEELKHRIAQVREHIRDWRGAKEPIKITWRAFNEDNA